MWGVELWCPICVVVRTSLKDEVDLLSQWVFFSSLCTRVDFLFKFCVPFDNLPQYLWIHLVLVFPCFTWFDYIFRWILFEDLITNWSTSDQCQSLMDFVIFLTWCVIWTLWSHYFWFSSQSENMEAWMISYFWFGEVNGYSI